VENGHILLHVIGWLLLGIHALHLIHVALEALHLLHGCRLLCSDLLWHGIIRVLRPPTHHHIWVVLAVAALYFVGSLLPQLVTLCQQLDCLVTSVREVSFSFEPLYNNRIFVVEAGCLFLRGNCAKILAQFALDYHYLPLVSILRHSAETRTSQAPHL